jgi:hypothetical protein
MRATHAALGLFLTMSSCASNETESVVEVRHTAEAVIGLPLPVQLIVTGPAKIVPQRLGSDMNPFECELRSGEAIYWFPKQVLRTVNLGRRSYRPMRPETISVPARPHVLARGESCEILIDLNAFTPMRRGERATDEPVRLTPGLYELVFLDPDLAFDPPHTLLRLVEPNRSERRLIDNVAAREADGSPWDALVGDRTRALRGVDLDGLSEAARRQLAYHLTLADLVASNEPLSQLATQTLDAEANAFPEIRTELLVLRYELDLARRDAAASATRQSILALRPSAAPLLDQILDSGAGLVAHYREKRHANGQ